MCLSSKIKINLHRNYLVNNDIFFRSIPYVQPQEIICKGLGIYHVNKSWKLLSVCIYVQFGVIGFWGNELIAI